DPWLMIPVPHRNTSGWTEENCQKAFKALADQPKFHSGNWPEYIPQIIRPCLLAIKIKEKPLCKFLKKEKLPLELMYPKYTNNFLSINIHLAFLKLSLMPLDILDGLKNILNYFK